MRTVGNSGHVEEAGWLTVKKLVADDPLIRRWGDIEPIKKAAADREFDRSTCGKSRLRAQGVELKWIEVLKDTTKSTGIWAGPEVGEDEELGGRDNSRKQEASFWIPKLTWVHVHVDTEFHLPNAVISDQGPEGHSGRRKDEHCGKVSSNLSRYTPTNEALRHYADAGGGQDVTNDKRHRGVMGGGRTGTWKELHLLSGD
ncbi:hypothetical protein C8R44DRAFT_738723 [Mycena epipterygia]|nr:hypothetical protein C8R44DRAFT_738723 [Mycena epipterygia]